MSCTNSTNIFLFGLVSGMTSDIRSSNISQQELMTFAYAFSVTLLVVFGIISNILSIDTFCRRQIRTTTVGLYLIVYSYCSIFGILMLQFRLIRMLNSFSYTASFIICNIVSGLASIFTRICLWMSGVIALQRSLFSFKPNPLLNMIRSRKAAQKQILFIVILISLMHIHELICRVSVSDPLLEGNFICQIKYSPPLLTLNTLFSFMHIFVPFLMSMLANGLILTSISRRRAILHHRTYWLEWLSHFRRHRHLFIAPTLTIICIIPQLTLSLSFSCVNSSIKWLLRLNTAANLLIYIPQAMTFFAFISLSETYFEVFKTQSNIGKFIYRYWNPRNTIAPLPHTVA